jgi:hypothetical protein
MIELASACAIFAGCAKPLHLVRTGLAAYRWPCKTTVSTLPTKPARERIDAGAQS